MDSDIFEETAPVEPLTLSDELEDERAVALALYFVADPREICWKRDHEYHYGGSVYMVLDDHEADDQAKERLKEMFWEGYGSDIPDNLRFYFDVERYAADAIRYDGRGFALAVDDIEGVVYHPTTTGVQGWMDTYSITGSPVEASFLDYLIYRVR